MPSLYDTSTSASSIGSRSSSFFPKSHPKQPTSYYNQYSFASAAKNASQGERTVQSELGWVEPLQHEVVASSARRRQQPVYASSEPGITHHQTESDRYTGYINRFRETAEQKDQRYVEGTQFENMKERQHQNEENVRGVSNANDFRRHQYQQSREERPSRGRSPNGSRNTSGSSDDIYLRATDRSRSVSSTQRFSKVRMEPMSNFRAETTKQTSLRQIRRSSSPVPRSKSPSLDRSFYEKSSSVELSFEECSSEIHSLERGNDRSAQLTSARESAGSPHPKAAQISYNERAVIETPTPTSVRDLKQKLWDPNETLHHWHSQNERLQKSQIEPRRLGFSTKYSKSADSNTPTESTSTTSSSHYSLSPKPSRVEESRVNTLLLNPRYSRAAARVASRSPSRKVSAIQRDSPAQRSSARDFLQSELQPRNQSKLQTNSTDMDDGFYVDHESRVASDVKAESEVTAVMANKSVASLMARISAVKRNDPAEALAQIDAILSAESINAETELEEIGPTRRDNESDSKERYRDEDNAPRRQPKHVDQDSSEEHFDEESSIAATSVSSMTNPTYQGPSTTRNEVLSFSNKPSLLHAYGSTAIRASNRQEIRSPPPSTISLSNRDRRRKPGESARQPRKFLGRISEESHQFPPIMPSNSAELADKIRRWDEMSAPDITGVKSDDSGYPVEAAPRVPNTPANRRRAHPWDSSIPAHSTQMDNKGLKSKSTDWTKQYKPKRTAQEARYMATEDSYYFDEESNSIQAYPSAFPGDDFDVDRKVESKNGSTGETSQSMSHQQQEEAKTMSFDSTWVSVPESSFFQEHSSPRLADPEPQKSNAGLSSQPTMSSFDQDDAFSTPDYAFGTGCAPRQPDVSSPRPPLRSLRTDNVHRDVSLTPLGNRRSMQTFSPRTRGPTRDFRSLSPRAVRNELILRQSSSGDSSGEHGIEVALLNKPKSRGLRSFLPKRRPLKSDTVVLDQNMSYSSQISDSFAMDIELPPPLQNRGRRYGSTQDRERSRSLEDSRSRNPNIAKKFSRLLRVYDGDKGMI